MILVPWLFACVGGDGDTASADATSCGDPDGPGGDTGDIPDVLGTWSSTWGGGWYEDNCATSDLSATSESWIASFSVAGTAPTALYVYFGPQGDPATDRFWGAMDPRGGFTFSGTYAHPAGTLHAQFGGLVYADPNLDGRATIRGAGFLGLDVDDDGDIDCYANGSWTAFKSG